MKQNERPTFSPHLFWDCDASKIDFEAKWQFVIERVFSHGKWADWREARRFFGIEKMQKAAVSARYLDPKTAHYLSLIFEIPIQNFRCYDSTLSRPRHWSL